MASGAQVAASTADTKTNKARNDASSAAIQPCLTEENPMASHNTVSRHFNRAIVAGRLCAPRAGFECTAVPARPAGFTRRLAIHAATGG